MTRQSNIKSGIEWREPLLLLFVTVMAYGLLIPWLGYYYDDWGEVVFSDIYGYSSSLKLWYTFGRPIYGAIQSTLSLIINDRLVVWHLYAFVGRFLWSCSVWWLLRVIWPERRGETFLMSLFFAVYPGFTQQPIAAAYGLRNYSAAIMMVSYALMIRSVTQRKTKCKIYIIASLVLAALVLIQREDFFGLELWRPILLFTIFQRLSQDWRTSLKHTAKYWIPYAVFFFAYFIFRTFFWYGYGGAGWPLIYSHAYAVFHSPTAFVTTHAVRLYEYFANILFLPYFQPIQAFRLGTGSLPVCGFWAVTITVIVVIYLGYIRSTPNNNRICTEEGKSRIWIHEALLLGSSAVVLSVSHIFVVGSSISLETVLDRFTRVAMLGVAIVMVSLLSLMLRKRQLTVLIMVFTGLAAGYHFLIANEYRIDWKKQLGFHQHIGWRVPDLASGSTVLLDGADHFRHRRDYTIGGSLHILYQHPISVMLVNTDWKRAYTGTRKDFGGRYNIDQALTLAHNPPYCLRVVDPERLEEYPFLSNTARLAGEKSRLDLISPVEQPVRPLAQKLFFEDADSTCWCFYIEKAELARQFGEWDRVIELGDEMRALEVAPPAKENALELTVFMEGYARVGRYDVAEEIAQRIAEQPWGRFSVRSICERLEHELGENEGAMAFVRRVRDAHSIDSM